MCRQTFDDEDWIELEESDEYMYTTESEFAYSFHNYLNLVKGLTYHLYLTAMRKELIFLPQSKCIPILKYKWNIIPMGL